MLKNQKQREEYLLNKDNWNLVSTMDLNGKELFRIHKLKGTEIYKLETYRSCKYTEDHWSEHPTNYGHFVLSEDGLFKTNIPKSEAVRMIKDMDSWI